MDKILTPFLRWPHFKGKTRIETMLRQMLWTPSLTKVFGGLRMELDPAEWTQMQLLKRNWLEPGTLELYGKLLQPGDVFVDVGAHVGFHSLVARQLIGPQGAVIAIEPQPYNAQKILANWRANDFANLKLIIGAAGESDGWAVLKDQPMDDRALLTLRNDGRKDLAQGFEVPTVRLDSILYRHEIRRVRLLKLDVEGYEQEVINGLGERITQIDHIIFEQLPDASGTVPQSLSNCGFELRTVEDRQWNSGDAIPENNLWARRTR